MIVLNRLVQIAKMEKHAKQEKDESSDTEQSSTFTDGALIPKINIRKFLVPLLIIR